MIHQVGFDAGAVWKHLADNSEDGATLRQLNAAMKKGYGMSPMRVHMALGWLARENKVSLNGDDPNKTHVHLAPHELTCAG